MFLFTCRRATPAGAVEQKLGHGPS